MGGLVAIFVHVGYVPRAVVDTQGAIQATALANHTLEEVVVALAHFQFGKVDAALVYTTHINGFQALIAALHCQIQEALNNTTGLGKDATIERSIVQRSILLLGGLDVACIEEGLKLLKRHYGVNGTVGFLERILHLLGGAGADEYHLGIGLALLDEACNLNHRRGSVGDVLFEGGEVDFDESYERGAARGGQEFLLVPLAGLLVEGYVGTHSYLHYVVETELLDGRNNLFDATVAALADDCGCEYGVDIVVLFLGILEHLDDIQEERLVGHSTEGAGDDALSAHNTFIVVDDSLFVLIDADSLHFAALLTGAYHLDDSAIGAYLRTFATLDTLVVVDDGAFVDDGDGIFGADVLAVVSDTAAAGGSNEHCIGGTLVAGDVDYLDDVGILLVATACHTHALLENSSLFVDAAAQFAFGAGGDFLGDVDVSSVEGSFVGAFYDLFKYVVLEQLDAGIEYFVLLHNLMECCKGLGYRLFCVRVR